jgi:hypothetical protein
MSGLELGAVVPPLVKRLSAATEAERVSPKTLTPVPTEPKVRVLTAEMPMAVVSSAVL